LRELITGNYVLTYDNMVTINTLSLPTTTTSTTPTTTTTTGEDKCAGYGPDTTVG
jgi:hypothetical protein